MAARRAGSSRGESIGARHYAKFHWGFPYSRKINWPDHDFPRVLTSCGLISEFEIRRWDDGVKKSIRIEDEGSYLAYDPRHRWQRLYILLSTRVRADARQLWTPGGERWGLSALARTTGGKQATADYPDVVVQPIGPIDAVVYWTAKKGDEEEQQGVFYRHEHKPDDRPDSKIRPILAVDRTGRLFYAGGDYHVLRDGIVD